MFAKLHPRTHRCQSSHLPRNSPNNFGACGLPQVWRYTASHVCPWQCFFSAWIFLLGYGCRRPKKYLVLLVQSKEAAVFRGGGIDDVIVADFRVQGAEFPLLLNDSQQRLPCILEHDFVIGVLQGKAHIASIPVCWLLLKLECALVETCNLHAAGQGLLGICGVHQENPLANSNDHLAASGCSTGLWKVCLPCQS